MLSKYPKFRLIFISIFLASIILGLLDKFALSQTFSETGYYGIFIAGLLYSYSFSGAFSAGILLAISNSQQNLNPFIGAIIGGLAAGLSDLFILKYIKENLTEEIMGFLHEKYIEAISSKIHTRIKKIFNPVLGIIFIASPLPDEIGLTFLSGIQNLNKWYLFAFCSLLNGLGIFIILSI
jgi:hypothetical protein